MMFGIVCKQCSATFYLHPSQMVSIRGPRLYCSMACRDDAIATRPRSICRWCSQPTKRRDRVFCCKPCRGAYQKALKLPKFGPLVPKPSALT